MKFETSSVSAGMEMNNKTHLYKKETGRGGYN